MDKLKPNNNKWPMENISEENIKILSDIAIKVIGELSDENKKIISEMPDIKIGDMHFSLGLYIRNKHIYGNKSMKGLYEAGYEPDNISTIIMYLIWAKLHNMA
jgi:hypothetical protein